MKKRYPFVLTEILLAIALFTAILAPLISFPMKTYKKDLQSLRELDLARQNDVAFLAVLKNLAETNYYEEIGQHPIKLTLDRSICVDLPKISPSYYTVSANITKGSTKKQLDEEYEGRLMKVEITLFPDGKKISSLPKKTPYFARYYLCLPLASQNSID